MAEDGVGAERGGGAGVVAAAQGDGERGQRMSPDHPCDRCGAPHACHGLGPPAQPVQGWYCGPCLPFQPHSQRKVALAVRALLDD